LVNHTSTWQLVMRSGVREGQRTASARIQGCGPLGQLQILHLYFTVLLQPVYLRPLHIHLAATLLHQVL